MPITLGMLKKINAAIRSGKFIYDVSGNRR